MWARRRPRPETGRQDANPTEKDNTSAFSSNDGKKLGNGDHLNLGLYESDMFYLHKRILHNIHIGRYMIYAMEYDI